MPSTTSPSDEALDELHRKQLAIRAANARGEDTQAARAEIIQLMRANGFGDEVDLDESPEGDAAGNNSDVVACAILKAEAQSDTATADDLRALKDKPDELAAMLEQLQPDRASGT